MARLHFYGGAGGVTGACYLLETVGKKILIDCGLFQGGRFTEKQNHDPFPFNPSEIDVLCVTHAHTDHTGRIPKLYKDGFRGMIISTPPTRDLAEVMFNDTLKIMKHELEQYGDDHLFSENDVQGALSLFKTYPYHEPITLEEKCTVTLRESAHILGSAMVDIEYNDTRIVFTGDLGNTPAPLLGDIFPVDTTDYLLIDSVYGNRLHEGSATRTLELERTIENTVTHGGTIIIPAFALERIQALLSDLNELVEHNRIPRIPIFVDSPLAIAATRVYKKYENYFSQEVKGMITSGDDIFRFPGLTLTPTREDSKKINEVQGPKIILAGNPHGYGSRIAYHFKRYLPDPNSTVIFAGYARVSSLGRKLVDGAKEVSILGQRTPVHAKILTISGYSAHADQKQLTSFVAHIAKPIKKVFVTMGDPAAAEHLKQLIRDELGIDATTPSLGDVIELI
ncbi:MAG: MBL fold metallo-hydrolase [bacterium]|nr:MBL fold metallo-hydrolase [bacterium]